MNLPTLRGLQGPEGLPTDHLRALWHDLHGDWDTAHRIVQVMDDRDAMWIHAYLHRKEPDISNAKYWYRRCEHPYPDGMTSEAEAEMILSALTSEARSAV
jgi:hypothetical protein